MPYSQDKLLSLIKRRFVNILSRFAQCDVLPLGMVILGCICIANISVTNCVRENNCS